MAKSVRNHVRALVLQGGGALGAYQAGVYEALHEAGQRPDWIAGISIGAINAAIIAGNPPERRIERLRAFWDQLSSRLTLPSLMAEGPLRSWFNEMSATMVAATGIPGFFEPRLLPPQLATPGTTGALSYYDTSPLEKTLLDLIDFDLLNSGAVQLSVGAVHVTSGNFIYFCSHERKLGPKHIMASGALPPGFAPVMIDGEAYWDGGIVSNTPLQFVLDHRDLSRDVDIFQVDLFHARGSMPRTMNDVLEREKDIRYSSRTRLNTDRHRELLAMRAAARRLAARLPKALQKDADLLSLTGGDASSAVTILHLINRNERHESQSKDYEFSRQSINDHWQEGYETARRSLADPRWIRRKPPASGIMVLDFGQPDG